MGLTTPGVRPLGRNLAKGVQRRGRGPEQKQGREQGRGRDRCAGGAELGTGPGTNEKHNLNDTSERKETRRAESTSSQGGRGRTRLKREKRQERTGTRKEKQHCAGRGRRNVFLLCRLLAGTAPRHVASPLQKFLGSQEAGCETPRAET